MSRRVAALCAVLLSAALMAACGSKPHPKPVHTTPKVVNGHRCTPHDEALQCRLPPAPSKVPPPPPANAPPVTKVGAVRVFAASFHPGVIQGVDFAWGAPSAARMRALGAKFGASYFSYDRSKGWQQRPGLVSEYHRNGIATVGVWETTANRAGQGCSAGRADAVEARRQAAAVGNTDRPIDFAIDFDASGPQVDGYFRCAHAVLGSRANAYGSYYALKYLCAHGLVGHTNWQTYAWSRSQWLPASCAPLEQYLNDTSVDYDRAIAADYGQWPGPATASKAQVRTSLRFHREERLTFHRLIERHHCRKGQHVTPRLPLRTRRHLHDRLCPRWTGLGNREIRVIHRLERQLAA